MIMLRCRRSLPPRDFVVAVLDSKKENNIIKIEEV
jgi:hypothetical protein